MESLVDSTNILMEFGGVNAMLIFCPYILK